jgi:hypothetical protein
VVLHRDEPRPAVLTLQVQDLAELPRVHRRGAEVAGLAGLHDVVEGLERLLDRRRVVHAVDLVEVDVVGAEPAEAVVDLGEDRLARQTGAVGPGRIGCRTLVAMTTSSRSAKSFSARPTISSLEPCEYMFAVSKKLMPALDCLLDQRAALLLTERPDGVAAVRLAVGHAAERDGRDVEAGVAQFDVVHLRRST